MNQHGVGNETGLASLQLTSSPSSPIQLAMKDCTHHRGLPPSTLNDQQCGLFNVHKNKTSEGAVRRDHGFRPYPQNRNVRLFYQKIDGGTFSWPFLSGWGLDSRLPARQTGAYSDGQLR